ncbi:Divalent cation transporter superfamily protein [Giardia duodenalis]|uniref:Divalent cation transporter superfamily protein n=1 Tax=Giardia intestinalis TaxID=5741 RepID=V6TII3_GIAIN|nr:Divalent cation transporter superfamily protein [Giardia intestinalis]
MNVHERAAVLHGSRRGSALLSSNEPADTFTTCYKQIDLHTMALTETTLEAVLDAMKMSTSYYHKLLSVSSYITKCNHGLFIFVPGMRLIITKEYAYMLCEERAPSSSLQTTKWYEELHTLLKDSAEVCNRQSDKSLDKALVNLFNISSIGTASSPEAVVTSAVVDLLCKWNAKEYAANRHQFSSAREANNLILMQVALQQHEQHISKLDTILYCVDYFINQKFFPSNKEDNEASSALDEIMNFLKFLSRSLYALKYQIAEYTEYSNLYLSNYRDTLDRKRNKLIKIQLHITYISLGIGFVSLISGIFGINLMNFANYPDEPPLPYLQWSQMGSFKLAPLYIICLVSFGIFSIVVSMLTWYTRAKLDYEDKR